MTGALVIRVDRFGQVQLVPSFVYVPSGAAPVTADGTHVITTVATIEGA